MKFSIRGLVSVGSACWALLALAPLSNAQSFHHLQGGLLNDVFFLDDATNGWAVGDGGRVLRTTNGGSSWVEKQTPNDYRGDLFGIQFVSSQIGFAVGDQGVILKSTNGGNDWNYVNNGLRIYDVFAGTVDGITYTCGTHPAKLQGIHMSSATEGWVVGWDGAIATTTDGGQSWTRPPANGLPADYGCNGSLFDLYKVHFFYDATTLNGSHYYRGVVTSEYGKIITTEDGGATWTYRTVITGSMCPSPGGNIELWGLSFDDPADWNTRWWVCGGVGFTRGFVLSTTDHGQTFDVMNRYALLSPSDTAQNGAIATLYGVQAFGSSQNPALTVGYGSLNLATIPTGEEHTINFDVCAGLAASTPLISAGDVWVEHDPHVNNVTQAPSGEVPAFFGVTKVSGTQACLVGAFGRIMKWSAPSTFQEVGTPYHDRLRDAAFIKDSSFNKGLACGQGWAIWATNDGGATWELSSNGAWIHDKSTNATGIDISPSGNTAVAVGSSGFVARGVRNTSTNTWTWTKKSMADGLPQNLGDLNAVAYEPSSGSTTVFAVGNFGTVLKSTNDGQTWTQTRGAGGDALYGVSFIDANLGFVAGSNGKVYTTSNGAASAFNPVAVFGNPLTTFYDIAAYSTSSGASLIVVGAAGAIFKKDPSDSQLVAVTDPALVTRDDFLDVEIMNSGADIRIGASGGKVYFKNSGAWVSSPAKCPTTFPIEKVCFKDPNNGYAIGTMFVVNDFK